jgi:hypothetical protein
MRVTFNPPMIFDKIDPHQCLKNLRKFEWLSFAGLPLFININLSHKFHLFFLFNIIAENEFLENQATKKVLHW